MKILSLGFLALISMSAFADDLVGLNCSANYIIHEVSKRPKINRVTMRQSLAGGPSVLRQIPVNHHVKNFGETIDLDGTVQSIDYRIDVQEENTTVSVRVRSGETSVDFLKDHQVRTKEGFSESIYLSEMIKIGNQQVTNVVLTCLPSYK